MSSSWPEIIPASQVKKGVVMLAFLVHTRVFPTCACGGWGNVARAWSRVRVAWQDGTESSRVERAGEWRDVETMTRVLQQRIYIYIYILTGKFWDDWSFQQRFWFFFFLFRITLYRAFYSEKTCLYFWLVFGKHLILGREGEEVVISGRRAERIWIFFFYWLQCSPSFLPPPWPL